MKRINFILTLLREYSHENQIPIRSTSDLSPLEEWLLIRLFDKSEKESIEFLKWFNDFNELGYTEKGIIFYVNEYLKTNQK